MFLLIDKPIGITSYDVVRKIKKILWTKKVGHIGTLDPLATGCLLIATDNSTKLIHLLEGGKKRYRFTVQFDGTSESLDIGTEIHPISTETIRKNVSEDEVIQFLLDQKTQFPPKYSALHIGGKRAYTLAKKGVDFEVPEREIHIEDVSILQRTEYSITLELTISSGGYIRSLAPVLGKFFGVQGGYISSLRRTQLFLDGGSLGETQAQKIDEPIQPISLDKIFHTIPTIELNEREYHNIINGLTIIPPELEKNMEGILRNILCSYQTELSLCQWTGEHLKVLKNKVH